MSISVYDPITKKLTQIAGNSNPSSYSIGELEDVDISSPTDGQVLKYDATNEAWVNVDGGGEVDTELSPSSTNAVENRVIYNAIEDTNSIIAPVESGSIASQNYAVGDQFIKEGVLYKAIVAITSGDVLALDTNYEVSDNIVSQIKQSIPYFTIDGETATFHSGII